MFGKSLNSGVFKKFLSATLVALLVSVLAPSAARAVSAPTIDGVYQSADIGSVITVTGSGFNGVTATITGNPNSLPVSAETSTSISITVPAKAITWPATSASVTLVLTNSDSGWQQTTLTYYSSIPAFTTSAVLGGGVAGKTVSLTADSTCAIPQPCYFDSSVAATIQFGA
jgi:hypothetical protein